MSHLSHNRQAEKREMKRFPEKYFTNEEKAARDAALEAAMQQREQEKPVYRPEHEE